MPIPGLIPISSLFNSHALRKPPKGPMEVASSGFTISQTRPPSWKAPLLRKDGEAESTPGFFSTHAGQEEDILNEQVVKHGFVAKSIVQVCACITL